MPLSPSHKSGPVLKLAVFRLVDTCIFLQEDMEGFYDTAALKVLPGVLSVFRWCQKRSVKVMLVSDLSREDTNTILKRLGWQGTDGKQLGIACCVLAGDALENPIRQAMKIAQLTHARQLITVGDTPQFLNWSWAAGSLLNVGVTYGSSSYQELGDQPHHGLIDNILEIPNFIVENVVDQKAIPAAKNAATAKLQDHLLQLRLGLLLPG